MSYISGHKLMALTRGAQDEVSPEKEIYNKRQKRSTARSLEATICSNYLVLEDIQVTAAVISASLTKKK